MGYKPRRAMKVGVRQRLEPTARRLAPGLAVMTVVLGVVVAASPSGAPSAEPIGAAGAVPATTGPAAPGATVERETRANRGGARTSPTTPSAKSSADLRAELEKAAGKVAKGTKDDVTVTTPSTSTSSSSRSSSSSSSRSSGSSSGSGGSSDSGGSGSSGSSAACPSGSSVESGLVANAIKVHRDVCHRWPQLTSYGGVRADSMPEHPSGRALDIMISNNGTGWEVARYLRANAGRLGISQVIFDQQIWTVQRSGEGWRGMSDRGGATANHRDHVHVTVYG